MSDLAEHVVYQRAYEARIRSVHEMIEIEAAMRDGAAFRSVIEALENEETRALTELRDCDPTKIGMISVLQAQAQIAQVVRNAIQDVFNRGKVAEKSLQDEDTGRD